MHFGVSMFNTDYSIPAVELDRALEGRGFEAMWAHGHAVRGEEVDLDRGETRRLRRGREYPANDYLAEAGAETASADHLRRRLSARRAAGGALLRRVGPDRRPRPLRRRQRLPAQVQR